MGRPGRGSVFLWEWELTPGINYAKKNKNLLCFNTGGPCQKINRPLELTHKGLGITDTEIDIVFNHLAATLKEFKVPEREHDEVMAKIGNLRSDIVERKN